MKINTLLILGLMLLLNIGCSSTNYMGAKKWRVRAGMFAERWYLNPQYSQTEIPKGTGFYGAAAEKMKHKFIIKYYILNDTIPDTTEIPKKDMRKIKRKGYMYIKTADNKFIKSTFPSGLYPLPLVPIKKCYANGYCKLYPTHYKELYIKRSSIY